MKSSMIAQAIDFLQQQPNIQRGEFYFLLASFVMYFKSPLKKESWNTFTKQIENGSISIEKGILMTDEHRNPHVFKSSKVPTKTKQDLKDLLFQQLLKVRKSVEKYPFQSQTPIDIIVIPDIIDPSDTPTLFPKEYLHKQIQSGECTNELTGHPLSWNVVESLKHNQTPSTKIKLKKVSPKSIIDFIQKDILRCTRLAEHCFVCKSKQVQFKSVKNYQTLRFCSLKCIEKWDHRY